MPRARSGFPSLLVLAMVIGTSASAAADPIWYGPAAYGQASDSPLLGSTFSYFHLETFEDGSLNTPGVSGSGGVVVGPGTYTDSVDGDDGIVDGFGSDGYSLYSNWTNSFLTFTFDEAALGVLPTHAGLVMTDIGYNAPTPYFGPVSFEAFGPLGTSLGAFGLTFGDGYDMGQSAEDRFFGLFNADGISSVKISTNNYDWEVDHLQYGAVVTSVPEPSTLLLLGTGLAAVCVRRYRRES